MLCVYAPSSNSCCSALLLSFLLSPSGVHCCIVSGWIANPSNSFERDGEGRHAIDFGLLDSAGGGCYRLRGPTPYRKRTKALFAVAIGPLQHMRDVLYSVMAEGGDSDDDPMIGNGQGRKKRAGQCSNKEAISTTTVVSSWALRRPHLPLPPTPQTTGERMSLCSPLYCGEKKRMETT